MKKPVTVLFRRSYSGLYWKSMSKCAFIGIADTVFVQKNHVWWWTDCSDDSPVDDDDIPGTGSLVRSFDKKTSMIVINPSSGWGVIHSMLEAEQGWLRNSMTRFGDVFPFSRSMQSFCIFTMGMGMFIIGFGKGRIRSMRGLNVQIFPSVFDRLSREFSVWLFYAF